MAKIDVQWAKSELISVSDEARELGFDLRKFDRQNEEVQASVRKASIDRVIYKVRNAWDDAKSAATRRDLARSATASTSSLSATASASPTPGACRRLCT